MQKHNHLKRGYMKTIYFLRLKAGSFGGAENYLKRLQHELTQQSIKFENINSKTPSFFPSWLKAMLFSYLTCKTKKDKLYFSLERVTCADIYRAGDGVHKEFLKTKKRSFNPLNLVYLYIEKRLFKNAKLIIANSNFVKSQIISNYNIDKGKIEVIYNGVKHKDIDKIKLKELKNQLNLKHEKTILFVGSGFERKGVEEFLNILSKLTYRCNGLIIGKDKNIQKYKIKAQNMGLEVNFLGKRDDVDLFYALSDIFLFPTKYEPFSNVILEAMSFKCVAFTTMKNGASEILPKEQIIQKDISEKIDTLLKDNILLSSKKEENYKISLNFTIEKNTNQTLDAIKSYLKL